MAASFISPMASSLIQPIAFSLINSKTGKEKKEEKGQFLQLIALPLMMKVVIK